MINDPEAERLEMMLAKEQIIGNEHLAKIIEALQVIGRILDLHRKKLDRIIERLDQPL